MSTCTALNDVSPGSFGPVGPPLLRPRGLPPKSRELPFAENDNVRIDREAGPQRAPAAVAAPHRVEITPAKLVKRRALTWTGMAAEFVEFTGRAKAEYRFRAPVHLLVVYEQAARLGGETFVEGLPPSSLRDSTRKLTFVPAGREYHEWLEPRTLTRLMFFYFDPAKLPLASESGVTGAALAPRLFFEDATLWDTALKLKRLAEKPSAEDRLYCEAVGAVLVHELMRHDRRGPGAESPVRGGLAGWQQRLVTAYIEDHFAEQIPLATLAGLARLSPFHFCRAFKQSFGVPPHRYHTSRRIERAKAMLAKPEISVTDIGLTVGFSETSSFTAAFRRATGITPTGYHRSLG